MVEVLCFKCGHSLVHLEPFVFTQQGHYYECPRCKLEYNSFNDPKKGKIWEVKINKVWVECTSRMKVKTLFIFR